MGIFFLAVGSFPLGNFFLVVRCLSLGKFCPSCWKFAIVQCSYFVYNCITIKSTILITLCPILVPHCSSFFPDLSHPTSFVVGLMDALMLLFILGVCWFGMGFLTPTGAPVSASVSSTSAAVTTNNTSVPTDVSDLSVIFSLFDWLPVDFSCITSVSLVAILAASLASTMTLPVPSLSAAVSSLPISSSVIVYRLVIMYVPEVIYPYLSPEVECVT